MALPEEWTLVPVRATYTERDGTPGVGQVKFWSDLPVNAFGVRVPPKVFVGELVDGVLKDADDLDSDLMLPSSTVEGVEPSGWVYEVDESGVEGMEDRPRWLMGVPDDADEIDLAVVVPSVRVDETSRFLTEAKFQEMYAARALERLRFLDSYASFFGSPLNVFVAGQATTATTTTAVANAGATVISVASAAGYVTGVSLVTKQGTAAQQIHRIASVAGNDLTLVAPLSSSLASGAAVNPLWTNSTHLSNPAGMTAFAYWAANASEGGELVLQDPVPGTRPIVWFGNSWMSQAAPFFATAVDALYPNATVVNASVAGNNSAALLARFAADVPSNAAYVLFNEPGVNDSAGGVAPGVQAANLEALVRKIRAIGAVPVYTGPVPLSDFATATASRELEFVAYIGDGRSYPAVSAAGISVSFPVVGKALFPNATSMGVGTNAQRLISSGANDTALGQEAQSSMTTGSSNTAVGYAAQQFTTTTGGNTGVGYLSQRSNSGVNNTGVGSGSQAAVTGSANTALGANAQLLLTSGSSNTALGTSAQYAPGGVSANATTTGLNQTSVGTESGQGSTTQRNYITTVGWRSTADADSATALGASTKANHAGSVALGQDSLAVGATTTAVDQIMLGTTRHRVTVPGRLNVARITPTGSADAQGALGDVAVDDGYVYVKTSTGWKRAALTTF